jgi:ABC-type branched-subunit amino acid transport system substrate-binding protein
MDRRQLGITVSAALLALLLGAGVALLATSGNDESTRVVGRPVTTASSEPAASSTLPTIAPTTTRQPIVTVPTRPPGTVAVIPDTSATTRPGGARGTQPGATAPAPTVAPAATAPPSTSPPTTAPASGPTTIAPAATEPSSEVTTTSAAHTEPTEPGVSAQRIRLAVVADDVAVLDGARAWAAGVNRHGGIDGRKVRLDLAATGGTAEGYAAAVEAACTRDLAIVAGLSSFDADTAPLDCGIPDIPIEAIGAEHRAHETTYPAFPRKAAVEPVGSFRYLRSVVDGCCLQYVLVPDREPERSVTRAAIEGAVKVGFETVATPDVAVDASDSEYDELAQDLVASQATFVSSGLGRDSTITLRRAAVGAGVAGVSAWYCDARCYDRSFVSEGGTAVDGEYVAIETVPLSDRRAVAPLRSYVADSKRVGVATTYDGLRAYVAGLLAQQALKTASDHGAKAGVTRAGLLEALAGIHDFTGGGLVGPTNVGDRIPNGCTVVLHVHDGQFTRAHPTERGRLDCDPSNLVDLH